MNFAAWVEDRLALLDPGKDWHPDPVAALSRLRSRDRTRKRSWIGGAIAASIAAVLLVALPSPGSSDYECPACAQFYSQTYPLLTANYVQTGKIRILHRDFPLPQHPYARLAARYANAAGEAGAYEPAVLQLFKTQVEWAHTGNLDAALLRILPPGVMQQVRGLVRNGAGDATIAADQAAGYRDNLSQTPTLIIVARGKREKVAPIPSFNLLKGYLDRLIAQ